MQSKGVLVLSLCLNLGLLGAWAHYAKSRPTAEALSPSTSNPAAPVSKASPSTEPDTPATNTPATTNAPAAQFTWRSVEAADYKEYIANLRGIGCPEKTIRDIIIADVSKLFAPRFAALREPEKEFKFWKRNYGWGPTPDKERQKLEKALAEEQQALIKDLLGIDLKKEQNKNSWWLEEQERLLSFLPPEKREQLRKIQEQYDEQRQEVYRAANGYFDEDSQADLRKIYKKQLADLAQFMTPEEIREYTLRTSDTANSLRYQLSSMAPTEQEFRAIFDAKNLDEDYQNPTEEERADKDFMKHRREAQKKANEELKAALGEERYTEYTRSQDYAYTSLVNMGAMLGFDKAAANKVYDMKTEAESQANKIRSDQSLTPQQRTEALQAIRVTTTTEIIKQIGEKGYKAYRRQGGYWLSNISPN